MQGGALRGGNDPLGGTARWPHAPGGLPSAYDQAFHRADDEEPVFGRGTMKRNSQHYVEQAAGRAAGVRLTARHAASSAAAAAHAPSAYPASAYAPYAVAGKENSYGAAPGSKVAPLSLTLAVTLSLTLAVILSLILAVTLILTRALTRTLYPGGAVQP